MPKVSRKKAGADVTKPIPKLLVLKHGQKRVMVNRHKSYNVGGTTIEISKMAHRYHKVMLDNACKHFPTIPRNAMTFQTNQLDICEGQLVDITAETWDKVIESLTSVEVTRAESPLPIPLPPSGSTSSNAGAISLRSNNNKVRVYLVLSSDDILSATIELSARVQELVDVVAHKLGGSTDFKTMWRGSRLNHNRSIGSYNISNGDSISFIMEQVGGKPVIYLYSPSDIDVSVKLSLSPEWSFSAIYPVVSLKQGHGQYVEWNVRTHQDGSLTERNSGLDVSYLFWEAKTNSDAFPRSPASELQSVDVFSPTSSTLGDMDSIVISVDKVTVYLDKSLKALGLHTEARTSFITCVGMCVSEHHTKTDYYYGSYWLPSILKHEYIALRFFPQLAYERAAPLSLSPQPDIVTRVFMLFRGIRKEHLADWPNARMQAGKDVAWWADVVGVDLARASDTALFRVLEWGGMEVHV